MCMRVLCFFYVVGGGYTDYFLSHADSRDLGDLFCGSRTDRCGLIDLGIFRICRGGWIRYEIP